MWTVIWKGTDACELTLGQYWFLLLSLCIILTGLSVILENISNMGAKMYIIHKAFSG